MTGSPPSPIQTPTQEQKSPLRMRMGQAWPHERLRKLGPKQKDLLPRWVTQDKEKHGEDYLTVPVLEGMLDMLEEYYPEATVAALEALSAK